MQFKNLQPHHHRAFYTLSQLHMRLLRCKLFECFLASRRALATSTALKARAVVLCAGWSISSNDARQLLCDTVICAGVSHHGPAFAAALGRSRGTGVFPNSGRPKRGLGPRVVVGVLLGGLRIFPALRSRALLRVRAAVESAGRGQVETAQYTIIACLSLILRNVALL